MTLDKAQEIEARIDSLVLNLLGPLRTSKTVDVQAFSELYALLSELTEIVQGAPYISKKTVRILFLIFTSMLSEADHCRNPERILDEAWKLSEYMRKLFSSEAHTAL